MWWFLANLDFWQWLWVVVLGLLVIVGWLFLIGSGCGLCNIDLWYFFFGSEMYYFIIVDILFYCDIHIILFC